MSKIHNTARVIAGLMVCAAAAPLAFAGGGYHGSPSYTPDLLPPSSNPGECWGRVKIPAQYSHSSETVMTEEGYTKTKVKQPRLQSRQEHVLAKEASVRYEVRQPTFKTVSEQMMVRPAYDKLTVTPPQFKHITEKMQVSHPRLVWKRGNPGTLRSQGYIIHSTADDRYNGANHSGETLYGGTCGVQCEIWCLVEEPGESVSYTRKIMSHAGQVQRHTVPPKFQTITKQVVADHGGVREIHIPAEYQTVTVEDVVDPGGHHGYVVEPKYGTVNKKVLVSPERYEWRRVLCAPGTGGYSGGSSYSSSSSYSSGSSHSSGSYTSAPAHSSGSYGSSQQSVTYGGASHSSGGSYVLPEPTYNKYNTGHDHHKKREKLRHRGY